MADNSKTSVNFDNYVDCYEALLRSQLAFFSSYRDYFSEYKVILTRSLIKQSPERILDFGCGIGLSLPFLAKWFPLSKICAHDSSQKSLEYVSEKYPFVTPLMRTEVGSIEFDMIYVTGVLHHVAPEERVPLLRLLSNSLSKRGVLVIFEHNPYNLVTRHLVRKCEFDADAELITRASLSRIVCQADLSVSQRGYCLFFPERLRFFRRFESWLQWVPLGGQYFVVCSKKISVAG